MPPFLTEWLNLLVRWIHVIAAIMWIGDSFLFMWMDSSLTAPEKPREGAVAGELWMVHSGGFYEVVKRKFLAPHEMPRVLHWFKWQAYTTWITGFFLLGIVYYVGGGIYLMDRATGIGFGGAVAISLGLLIVGWLVYDALWSSPLARRPALLVGISCALVVATTWGLTRLYSGRASFIQIGAMLGTIMAANVWRRIIPAQTQMLAATRAGTPVDVSLGARAKLRSTHNHYMTLPVLFTMLSNHFPSTYGHPLNWLILTLIMLLGVAIKHAMNFGTRSNRWLMLAGAAALIGAITLTAHPSQRPAGAAITAGGMAVAFDEVQGILVRRCTTCHSAHPTNPSFPAAPSGIILEDPKRIHTLAPRILERAVITRTMPLGNLTGMTDEERATLGSWIAQGAKIEGAGR